MSASNASLTTSHLTMDCVNITKLVALKQILVTTVLNVYLMDRVVINVIQIMFFKEINAWKIQ